jgi:putative oxidoreductase
VVIIVGGLGVIFGVFADLAALLLAGFLFLTASIIHAFWKTQDPQTRQMEQIQFSKDLALAGGGPGLLLHLESAPGRRRALDHRSPLRPRRLVVAGRGMARPRI